MPDTTSRTLPVLPLVDAVVLPNMVVTVALESSESQAAARAADETPSGELLLVPRLDGRFAAVGTIARVEHDATLPNGRRALVLRGVARARVGAGVIGSGSALWVSAEPVDDTTTDHARELGRELRATLSSILERRDGARFADFLPPADDPGALADTAGSWPTLSNERKLEVLETVDVDARVALVLRWARDVLGELELAERIRQDVSEGMEKTQRDFLLRQQLAAIRKELGEDAEAADAMESYRERIEALPAAVREPAERELRRLERTPEQNPEHGWIRTWLDTVLDLPWSERSEEQLDVAAARRVLDADHTGLEDVKQRIVEHLAVRKLRSERGLGAVAGRGSGAVLTLVGPPGVGKTSLGESVARAMGRSFVRVALGGVRDEAEIRGHRRTYVGAMPGRIVRAIKDAGTMNPVVLLDEVDKLGSDFRGDPASALLEVLDPAQNHTFRDHYLEVDLDLSDVVFLATANVAETIPGPLFDRMEVIRLDGYTEDEKVAIARDHLLGRQLERAGLRDDEVTVDEDALRAIVAGYTREAGVRGLERQLAKLLRRVATRVATGDEATPVAVTTDRLTELLGRATVTPEIAERTSDPGVATGLAVTGVGGDILFVEATAMDGDAGLALTGQLGDVMKESAQIALSYLRSHAAELGLPEGLHERRYHVHFPAGAIPKDGPSAGITMVTALASLLTGRPVRSTVGMTGEVTLQGRVLPIGGVKQKLLAAHRAGLREVILPTRNGPDLEDVPAAVREQLTVHLVDDIRAVLDLALEDAVPAAA